MSNFGFILTRHVNSEKTNRYWNQCVKLIRTTYPFRKIVVIDDNSNQDFVSSDHPYKNVTIIQSEYPGRGELLPYIYYLRHKWFPNAVIIHDSLFVHRRITFETFKLPALPLWHHSYDKENLNNSLRIISVLKNNRELVRKMRGDNSPINILGMGELNKDFNLCFGGQAYIKLGFLEMLQQKYNITNLVNVIHNRSDRCCFERVIGLLFCHECPQLLKVNSLFGDILTRNKTFDYTFDEYVKDLKQKRVIYPFVKVWTGR